MESVECDSDASKVGENAKFIDRRQKKNQLNLGFRFKWSYLEVFGPSVGKLFTAKMFNSFPSLNSFVA